jgi:hypothetical protein
MLNGQTAKDAEVPLHAYELAHTQDTLPKQGNTRAILTLSSLFGVQSELMAMSHYWLLLKQIIWVI